MADIAVLGMEVRLAGADRAEKGMQRVTAASRRAEAAADGMSGGTTRASENLRKMAQATATLDGPLGGLASRFRSLGMLIKNTSIGTAAFTVALGAVALAVRRFASAAAEMADQWSDMNARVGLAIGDMDRSTSVMERLSSVAMRTYSSLELSAESFIRNATVLRELGKATSQQLDFTEALNLAFVVSGAKAERAAQLQAALGRAMAGGALRGQELNTVIESGGRVAELLALELGVGVNQLRTLGAQGKITSEVIYSALTKRLEQLRQEAELMPATIGDGFLLLNNAMIRLVGTLDRQYRISESVAGALVGLSQNLELVARSAVVAGATLLASFGGPIIAGIKAVTVGIAVGLVNAVRALTTAMMMNPVGALVGALAIAVTWVTQFGAETYKVGNTTVHVGNTMKAVWVTLAEAVKSVVSLVGHFAEGLWHLVTFNWSKTVDAAKGAASDIANSASRVAEAWRQITQIPGTNRFAFAGDLSMHLTPVVNPPPEAEQKNLEKLIAQMRARSTEYQHETNVIGMSTFASERYLNMQRLVQAAIKDGVPLTDERLRYLDQEASALARTTAAYEAAAEAQANLDDMRGTFQSTFSTFAQDIAKGTSALDSLASALSRVADKLIDMAVNNLFEGAFGKSGTPNSFFGNLANGNAAGGLLGGVLIPGILHNGGVVGNDNYPHRAVAASTFANAPRYHNGGIAGLKPNEVPAILERGEVVIPKGRVGRSSGGGVTVNINNHIDATGADAAAISRLENAIGQLSANQKRVAVEAVTEAMDRRVA